MELIISIAVLTAVVMVADVSLAIQGNLPKIVRVTLTAAAYVAVLGSILKVLGRFGAPPAKLPLWVFLVAGVAGGLASGLVASEAAFGLAVVSTILTPTLLATFHWVALQRWAWVRQRLTGRRTSPGGGRS